jgi:uncharacterized membrane protein YqjE
MASPAVRTDPSDRSVGTLLHDLSEGTAQLIRQEIRLARTELTESLEEASTGAVQMAIALVLSVCATGALVAGVILVLSQYALQGRTWLSSLIVAVVLGVLAAVFAKRGARLLSPSKLRPDQTTTSIKETAAWLQHPTKSGANFR